MALADASGRRDRASRARRPDREGQARAGLGDRALRRFDGDLDRRVRPRVARRARARLTTALGRPARGLVRARTRATRRADDRRRHDRDCGGPALRWLGRSAHPAAALPRCRHADVGRPSARRGRDAVWDRDDCGVAAPPSPGREREAARAADGARDTARRAGPGWRGPVRAEAAGRHGLGARLARDSDLAHGTVGGRGRGAALCPVRARCRSPRPARQPANARSSPASRPALRRSSSSAGGSSRSPAASR